MEGFRDYSFIEIIFPQPSLSEKSAPRVYIEILPCCEYRDLKGSLTGDPDLTLDELIDYELPTIAGGPFSPFVMNVGPIVLDGNPAYKIVHGYRDLDPSNPASVNVYSIKGDTQYELHYFAHPSDYHTYLPGVQKIVDSFRMLVS